MPRAKTFHDDQTVIVEILTDPSTTGFCKVKMENGTVIARHVDRLEPLDEAAISIIHKTKWSLYPQGKLPTEGKAIKE